MTGYINPYSQTNWLEFIYTFFSRIGLLVFKKTPLATDELQILVLSLLAASSAIVGVFLIYRKMTMLANALSHSVLFGVAVTAFFLHTFFHVRSLSFSFEAMFVTALLTGFLTAFLSHIISRMSRLQNDAAVGLVFTTLFALGILLISIFSRNAHIGAELVLGNVDALHPKDLSQVFKILVLNLCLVVVFFNGLKLTTFDPIFSKMQGLSNSFYNYLMIFLLSITAVGAFRAVGVVLVLSFFVVPALIAKLFAKSLEGQIALAIFVGIVASFLGVSLSRHFLSAYQMALSTGGITVVCLYTLYFLSWIGSLTLKKITSNSPLPIET